MRFTKIIYLLFFFLVCQISNVSPQKKNIDSTAYAKWSSVAGANITSNGEYVSYVVENEPLGNQTLFLQSTRKNWQRKFKGIIGVQLLNTKGKDYAIFLNPNDSLVIVSLGKSVVQYKPSVASFSICRNEESEWIAYQLKQPSKQLIVLNLNTGKKRAYTGVINNVMGDDGQTVILQTERKSDNQGLQELNWVDLSTGKSILMWQGLKAKGIVLDVKHNQMAFTSEKGLFLYNMTIHKLKCLINNDTTRLDSGLRFGGIKRFSQDGERLFIDLKEDDKQKPKAGSVEVWSYVDYKIQSQQENEIRARTYAAVVNLMDGKIIRLEQEFENLAFNSFEDGSFDMIRLITRDDKNNGDSYNTNKQSYYLISLKNGKRIPLRYRPEGLSPNGKYLVYLDPEQHIYVSYNIKTGSHNNIPIAFSDSFSYPDLERHQIAGWLDNDEAVLFYDSHDLWKVDLSAQKAPINITSGYGKQHDLVFSIVYGQYNPYPLKKNQKIILIAFNLKTKKNGFYSVELNQLKKPELLSIGDYIYFTGMTRVDGYSPIKAKNAEIYIVRRMSSNEAPNFFSTKDFKSFKRLTNLNSEKQYNWYTTELHTWTSLDGKSLQGVLYKPENFDPSKKYPVIFNYYERKSDNLNAYIKPEALCDGCVINIPTYISNGYLVFTPDIVYKVGDPMQGTYDAVISAAKYIKSLPYINSTKMGIQGCSWAGIQTNYLVTHTNLFAAACSASGIADWVSNYGRLFPNGDPVRSMYELGQFRMGSSLWEIPDAYIKNSPIFRLDKVTTPFLIMHTKKDDVCSYEDAIELFTGLRRLGKKSWMLVYPDANHGVFGQQAQDFSIRMMQFFDHYLKGKPAPIWMTTPIPAEKRDMINDLAYDTKIKTPGPGLLTPEEQRKVDSIMVRKPIMVELK